MNPSRQVMGVVTQRIITNKELTNTTGYAEWHYRLWSFKTRDTKLEIFLHKNQHTQRKLLNFENWISMGLRSFQKSEF